MTAAKNIELSFVSEDMKNRFEEEFNRFTADTALMEKIDAADTIEEIYEACKEKVQFTLDQYREIMKEVEGHIKSKFMDNQDEELTDADLEDVVGGFSWGSFWKKVGKAAAIAGIVVGVVGLGVVTGGAAFAGIATAGLAVTGSLGLGAGATIAAYSSTIVVAGVTGAIGGGAFAGAALSGINE